MANIRLTNLSSYRAYFQAIATSHVDIDGFKFGDKDVVRNDNRSDMPAKVLWAHPYERTRYGDRFSDNVHKYKVARIAYLVVPASEKFDDEHAAYDTCELVIEQIMSRLIQDKRGKDVAGDWQMIVTDINTWSTTPVEMKIGSTRYVGCSLEVTFQDPTNLSYNALKWT